MIYFIKAEKDGVARAKGVGEKENECTTVCKSQRRLDEKPPWALGDFGEFDASFVATVAGLYTRRGGPCLSVRGGCQFVPTRGPLYLLCNAAPQ